MHMPSKGLNARGAQKTFWPLAVPEIGPHPIIDTCAYSASKRQPSPQEGKIHQE
jgi:hypothetical protein